MGPLPIAILQGIAVAILAFPLSLVMLTVYHRFIFKKRFPLTKEFSFSLIKRLLISIIISFFVCCSHIVFYFGIAWYAQSKDPYNWEGWADYWKAPLEYPYVIIMIDNPAEPTQGAFIENYSTGFTKLTRVDLVAVEGKIILAKSGNAYYVLHADSQEMEAYESEEDFLAAWKSLSQKQPPRLLKPYEYYLAYWAKHTPSSKGLFAVALYLLLTGIPPLALMVVIHMYYRWKISRSLKWKGEAETLPN